MFVVENSGYSFKALNYFCYRRLILFQFGDKLTPYDLTDLDLINLTSIKV